MINFTPSQEKAIKTRDTNILVSAAAGSGKTLVLVNRILDLIFEERINIDDFLIVTFTNAAAKQMKDKIRKALMEKLKGPDAAFARKQLQSLSMAQISTMHSFCINILKEYYEYLAISPDFKILNNSSAAVLKKRALDKVMEDAYNRSDDDFARLILAYGQNRKSPVEDIIDGIYQDLQVKIDPLAWFRESISGQTNKETITSYIYEELEEASAILTRAMEVASRSFGPFKYIENLEDDLSQIDNLEEKIRKNRPYDEIIHGLKAIDFSNLKTIRKKDEVDEDLKESCKDLRNLAKKSIKKLQEDFESKDSRQIDRENELAEKYLTSLYEIIENYDRELKELKKESNMFSFSDIEHLTIELLTIDEIREKIKSKIKFIFYDEYQDINPLQEEIITRIKGDNNLFFVGDIKQSIYRFRLADPSLFKNRYKLYKETDQGSLIKLSDNFRSSPYILDFLNFIFENLMTDELGEINYKEEGQRLTWSREKDQGRVELVINEKNTDEEYGDIGENPLYVARKIKSLVKEGYKYKNIVLLLRNVKNRIEDYEKAFDLFSIPYFSDVNSVSLEDPEVSIFISYLRIIDNIQDDQALISSLLTPFGKMDENDLALIRAENDNMDFSQAFLSYDKDDLVSEKIKKFLEKLTYYRDQERRMKLSDFAMFLAEDSGLLAFIASKNNGHEKIQNIYAFIDRIKGYEDLSYASLEDFLSYVDMMLSSPSDSLEASKLISEADDVVRIMTIHKAKGLEFPIVFIADMEKKIMLREKSDPYIVDYDLGIGLRLVDFERRTRYKSAKRKIIEIKKEAEMKSEEMRLLYVATTRAIERLYLVGALKDTKKHLDKLAAQPMYISTYKSSGMLDWILSVALRSKSLTKNLDITENIEKSLSEYDLDEDHYSMVINDYEKVKEDFGTVDMEDLLKNRDHTDDEDFDRTFSFSYPYEEKTSLAFKKSVSEISKKNKYKTDGTSDFPKLYIKTSPILENIPDIMKEDKKIGPLARGSLIHFVFQNISYRDHTIDSIKDELDKMQALELISQEERQILDPQVFLSFFKSDLGKRALENLPSLKREKAFTMAYQDIYLDGQIDAFFDEGDGIVLYDFKTDKTIDKDRYKSQMSLYRQALETYTGLKVKEAYIYWVTFSLTTRVF